MNNFDTINPQVPAISVLNRQGLPNDRQGHEEEYVDLVNS